MELHTNDISGIVGAVVLALLGIAFGFKKFLKGWNIETAENKVFTMLTGEIERMGKQNLQIATELNRLQLDIIALNSEIRKLTVENSKLHYEVITLNDQVETLKGIIATHNIVAACMPTGECFEKI